jgi:hypothetical protein
MTGMHQCTQLEIAFLDKLWWLHQDMEEDNGDILTHAGLATWRYQDKCCHWIFPPEAHWEPWKGLGREGTKSYVDLREIPLEPKLWLAREQPD